MDAKPVANLSAGRFAAFADGRIVALVADGLPAWPIPADATAPTAEQIAEHFASITDDQVHELEQVSLYEFARLDALVDDAGAPNGDLDAMQRMAAQVRILRELAAARGATAGLREQLAAGDDPAAATGDEAPAPAAAPTTDERAAAIAAMRVDLDGPAAPEPMLLQQGEPLDLSPLTAALATAVSTAIETAVPAAVAAAVQVRSEPAPEARGRLTAADFGRPPQALAPSSAGGTTTIVGRLPGHLVASADVPGRAMGAEITEFDDLVEAFMQRHQSLGRSSGVDDEMIPVATFSLDNETIDPAIDLRGMTDRREARRKILSVIGPKAVGVDPFTGKEALIASGGISPLREPYYPQLVIAQSATPFIDSMTTMVLDRGGLSLVLPPSLGTLAAATAPGTFADGVTATSTALTSATAAFTGADVGSFVYGSEFAAGTRIATITSGTVVVLDRATLSTGTGRTFTISGRNPNNLGAPVGLQTAAADALGNTVKSTYDVPNGSAINQDVYALYVSLQFSNLSARTNPEAVEANIRLTDALAARVAETQAMDVVTKWSTLFTGAKTFGTARQLLAQLGHMAAFYRNSERMDPRAVLRTALPAWAINAMRADYLSTFIGGGAANWGLSDDEIVGFFTEHRLMPTLFWDGPSDTSQLFDVTGLAGATGNGTTAGTPIAIPDYPGSGATTSFRTKVVTFMWAEGTWIGGTTGELNVGLVRDSVLNAQNKFRNFQERWSTPIFVGTRSLRGVHTVAADGTYGAAASITLGVGSGI